MSKLSSYSAPISDGLLVELIKTFPGPRINNPEADVKGIMWDAAQKAVVDWIINKLPQTQRDQIRNV